MDIKFKIFLLIAFSIFSISLVNASVGYNTYALYTSDYVYFVDSTGLMSYGDGTYGWVYASFLKDFELDGSSGEWIDYLQLTTKDDSTAHNYNIVFGGGGSSAYFCQNFQILVKYYDSSNSYTEEYLDFGGTTYAEICNGNWRDYYSGTTITAYPNTPIVMSFSGIALSINTLTEILQQ